MILKFRSKSLPHKPQGFAAVSLLLFFPLFFALLFSIAFIGFLIQHKTRLRSTCITEATQIQKNLIRNEENLFRLNPLARALRLQLNLAYAELAAAVAAQNPAWQARVGIKISRIKKHQRQLDKTQKLLLQKARLDLQMQTLNLQIKLQQNAQQISSIWQFYLDSLTAVTIEHFPQVSVKPDSSDVAPVYELKEGYSKQQKLAYRWQHRFYTKPSTQKLLDSENQFEMFCAVSAQKERNEWRLSINAVKF